MSCWIFRARLQQLLRERKKKRLRASVFELLWQYFLVLHVSLLLSVPKTGSEVGLDQKVLINRRAGAAEKNDKRKAFLKSERVD